LSDLWFYRPLSGRRLLGGNFDQNPDLKLVIAMRTRCAQKVFGRRELGRGALQQHSFSDLKFGLATEASFSY
jgi:hypothetical protein